VEEGRTAAGMQDRLLGPQRRNRRIHDDALLSPQLKRSSFPAQRVP
jgi:hypothetical protein